MSEAIAQKGKVRLDRGALGGYTVTTTEGATTSHPTFLAAWSDYCDQIGFTDTQPPDTRRR